VVLILAASGLILSVASAFDQGYRFSKHKN
jgi:hypothetical protein